MVWIYAYKPFKHFGNDEHVNASSDNDLLEYLDSYVEIQEVATEVTQTRNTEGDPYFEIENAIGQLEETTNCSAKSCANCSKPRRVTNVDSLRKGQHISMSGQISTKLRIYDHHAIVKEIKSVTGTLITMVLIHFHKKDEKIDIYEQSRDFDIREEELYIVDYVLPRYDPNTIVARAESILSKNDKFKNYNLFTCNCEHFATWCVAGEGESLQVQSLRQKFANGLSRLFGDGSKIANGLELLLFNSVDEIVGGFDNVLQDMVLNGTTAVYLIYCIVMSALHVKDYKKGQMCGSCLKGELLDLWLTFGAFGLTSIITSLISHFVCPLLAPGVGISLMILLVLLAVAFQMTVPKLRKSLSSPFSVDHVKVTSLEKIGIGDALSYRLYGFKHTSIVTKVKTENDNQTKGCIRIVHYGSSALFGTRKIVEEYVEVDINKWDLYLLKFKKPLCIFPAEVVVSRARSRIGETKWAMFSNRSDHFSYWAKVQQYNYEIDDDISNGEIRRPMAKTKASLFIEKREIHRIEDLRIGDVVQSDVIGIIDDTGILSSIRYLDGPDRRKFEIEVYTYSFLWTITRKKYTVDLNKARLYVKVYNPSQCQTMEQRVKNAQEIEDETGSWWTTEGFIEHCVGLKSN